MSLRIRVVGFAAELVDTTPMTEMGGRSLSDIRMLDAVDVLDFARVGKRVAAGLEDPAEGRELRKDGVAGLAGKPGLARIARHCLCFLTPRHYQKSGAKQIESASH